jgi:hypothetical protein
VSDKEIDLQLFSLKLAHEAIAEFPNAGAAIAHEDILAVANFDAGRIAAVL